MSDHPLHDFVEPLSVWLGLLNDSSHLLEFLFTQLHVSTSPILLKPCGLGRPNDRDQPLTCYPRQSQLCRCTSLLPRQLLDLFYDRFVLVKVLTLEFGNGASEIVRGKIIWSLVIEFVDEPAVAQG